MPQWRRVAQSTDIEENKPLVITLDEDETVLLTRVAGKVSACGNSCPHYGGPLGDGVIRDGRVVCPYHNATFHLLTGALDRTPAMDDLPVYDVKEEDGSIFLGEKRASGITMPDGSDGRSVLIVGGGAAGSACAETLRREGFAGEITVVTADSEAPYDRPMLSKGLLSGEAPAKYLPLRPNNFYEGLGIKVLTSTKVTSVNTDRPEVQTESGETIAADMMLLATGGVPRSLGIPGSDLSNVFTLRSHSDAQKIATACENAKRAVVIGGSFIGMEVAAQLRQRGLEVTVVEPQPQPLAAVLGPEVGAWLQGVHEEQGVEFQMGRKPQELVGKDDVAAVQLDNGTRLDADLVVVGVGVEPRVDYLDGSGLVGGHSSDGVRVDETLATGAKGIFAAGDIALYPHDEHEYRVEHWVHAQEQGRHVARAMLGSTDPYVRIPFFWSRQYKIGIKYAGYPQSFDHVQYDGVPGDGEFVAGYFTGDRLTAVAAMGKANKFVKLAELLENGEHLGRGDFLGVRDTADEE